MTRSTPRRLAAAPASLLPPTVPHALASRAAPGTPRQPRMPWSSARRLLRAGPALSLPLALVGTVAPVSPVAFAVVVLASLAAPTAHAQDATYPLDIPAGDLGPALNRYARSTGVLLSFDPAVVAGKTAPALRGTYTVGQGFAVLLANAGLAAVPDGRGGYALTARTATPAGPAGAGAAATTLGTIAVSAPALGSDIAPRGFVARQAESATKTGTPINETPRSIAVITRDELDVRGAQSLPEAVRYTAGVVTGAYGYDPRFDQISIRGFPVNTYGDYRDGLRQGQGSYAYFKSEPYGLERIDVVKGPASVLYGQSTPGGLIDRISKQPAATPLRELEVQAGNHDRKQVGGDFGGALDAEGKVLWRVTGIARDADTDAKAANNRYYLAPSLTWQASDKTKVTVLAHALKDETDSSVGVYQENGRASRNRVSDYGYDYQKQEQYQLGYRLDHTFNDSVSFTQKARYGVINVHARYLSGAGLVPGTRLLRRTAYAIENKVDTFVIDNQFHAKARTGPVDHRLLFGIDYQKVASTFGLGVGNAADYPVLNLDNPVYGNVNAPTPALAPRTGTFVDQLGVYVADQMSWNRWRFNVGVRRDGVEHEARNLGTAAVTTDKRSHAITTQAGVLYAFDNGVSPYASYATSFQPNTSLSVSGSPLDPTKARQFEVGVKFQPRNEDAFLTASLFDLTEQNAVRSIPGTAFSELTGQVRSRGLELQGKASLARDVNLTASYTYNQTEVTRSTDPAEIGKELPVTPRHTASLWADTVMRSTPLAGLGLGAGVRFIGANKTDKVNASTNPSATLVDLAVYYDLARLDASMKGWRGAVNVQNLFDKEMEVCNAGFCYRGQRRTVIASLRYRW